MVGYFVWASWSARQLLGQLQLWNYLWVSSAAPPNDTWGYVTTGGTEGNMYGLYLARELLPRGLLFYSEESHYSVGKTARVLRLPHEVVKTRPSGAMDCDDLRSKLIEARTTEVIVLANVGTTMREAVDDILEIRRVIASLGMTTKSYIHADAALSGMTLPFQTGAPKFDFAAGADSLSVSGHKFLGSPIPCGVVLARKSNVERIAESVEYIGTQDTTILGSRNGFTPLVMWYAIHALGQRGLQTRVRECIDVAEYAVRAFHTAGLRADRQPYAITVVFPRPSSSVIDAWQIAVHGDIGHLVAVPHVTKVMVDGLIADI
jgi:histidine decarboxylase